MAMKERMVAIRASIADIVNGSYGDDNGPRVVSPDGVELRRVLLVGNIIDQVTGNNNYASITIDDGTEIIRAKAWGAEADMLKRVSGNILAIVVGKVREYENEVYIVPEIVREAPDANLLTLHMLERQKTILRLGGTSVPTPKTTIEDTGILMSYDESASEPEIPAPKSAPAKGLAGKILEFIKEKGAKGTVHIDDIAKAFEDTDPVKVQLELIDLVDQEKIIEEEVGIYRIIN